MPRRLVPRLAAGALCLALALPATAQWTDPGGAAMPGCPA
jgi:beta-barrel assembly-enhancing protease